MESSSDCQVCSDRDSRRPMLLRTLGSCGVDLLHASSKKLSDLPCPFGPLIGYVNLWVCPLIVALEEHSLGLLAFADEQICALGYAVESYVPHSSSLLTKLRKLQLTSEHSLIVVSATIKSRGLIGFTADSWARYQLVVQNSALKAVSLASRVPLLSIITPTVCTIVTPMVANVSDWLLKHSEQVIPADCLALDLQVMPADCLALHLQAGDDKSTIHVKDVERSGISLDKSELKDSEVIKENVKIVEDKDDAGEVTLEEEVVSLLEMMDSGWSMGSSIFSSKATGQPKLS